MKVAVEHDNVIGGALSILFFREEYKEKSIRVKSPKSEVPTIRFDPTCKSVQTFVQEARPNWHRSFYMGNGSGWLLLYEEGGRVRT
jgi:hypothetical protein